MFKLFRYELCKRRGAMVGWTIGLVLYAVYILALYPSAGKGYAVMLESMDLDSPLFSMFGHLAAMTSFNGFFGVYVADYLPLTLAIYAIVNGTGALAGEEEDGTLELLLAQPLARWQIVTLRHWQWCLPF